MFYVDNNSGSHTMPALSPAQSNTPTWFTEGDGNKGISYIGQDWLNILQAELLNILTEAGLKPDKGKLNQLALSIKAIITANAYTQTNNLKEILDAGVKAQAAARSHLGLGKLATKDSLAPEDVNALAKDKNLSDLPDLPQALKNLTLASVKKYVESTNIGLNKLPYFRLTSEDELDAFPVGFIALCKNKTPGGPLPTESWCYTGKIGNLDNDKNDPKRKGGIIELTHVGNAGEVWVGVKSVFNDGTEYPENYVWARGYNTLYKPTPEDVGLADTKKAVDDTQIGLLNHKRMLINSAADLSALPSGAHRFVQNAPGKEILPTRYDFHILVINRNDWDNYSHILAVGAGDAGKYWIGKRILQGAEEKWEWTPLIQTVENLNLKDTVNRASHVYEDGNIYGTLWGGWLSNWLNQNIATKSSGSGAETGWFRDASTGLILQWGKVGNHQAGGITISFNTRVNFPIAFTTLYPAVFVTPNYSTEGTRYLDVTNRTLSGFDCSISTNGSSAPWLAIGR